MGMGNGTWAVRLTLAATTVVWLAIAPAFAGGPDVHDWDVAFGATVTSDYLSRGVSNSEHKAAIQPWAELDIGPFYGGYWGSNVSADGIGYWEHDFSVGVRPELGPVSLDFGYVYYVYNDETYSTPSGEVYGKVSVNPVEPLTIGAAFYVNPEATSATYSELNAAYALPHDLSVSGAVGFVTANSVYNDFTTWNLGVSWKPIEPVTLDARYHNGPDADRFVFSVSFASSLKSLGIAH